ncbi:hypothetical protein DDD63_04210 [Actinobaculum sp. 313]|nr:hypothetical protein DDD63_04210 [Actinobaculum sp. 313]
MRHVLPPTRTSDSGHLSMQLISKELCQCGWKLSGVIPVWRTRRTLSRSVGMTTSCVAVSSTVTSLRSLLFMVRSGRPCRRLQVTRRLKLVTARRLSRRQPAYRYEQRSSNNDVRTTEVHPMAQQKQDRLIFKVSILSIAVMQATAQSISGILNTMAEAMPHVDATSISSLSTVPNLGCLVGLFLSPILCKVFGERRVTIVGLLGSILAGCAPMVLGTFVPIYVSRLLLGFFFGMYTPLIVVLLSRFYRGDQLARMIGYENAIGSIGSSLCALVAGFLVVMGWQAGFAIYLLSAVPLVLFTLFVRLDDRQADDSNEQGANAVGDSQADTADRSYPAAETGDEQATGQADGVVAARNSDATEQPSTDSSAAAGRPRVPAAVWGLGAFLFCFFIFQLPMAYALGNRVFESGVAGDSQTTASTIASTIYSCFTIIGIPVSIFFGAIRKRIGAWTLPFALACNIIGFAALAYGSNTTLLFAGGLFSGVAFALVVPYAYTRVAEVSPPEVVSTSTTVAMLSLNLGVFCSPLVLPRIAAAVGDGSAHLVMLISTVAFLIFTVIMSIVAVTSSRRRNTVAAAA